MSNGSAINEFEFQESGVEFNYTDAMGNFGDEEIEDIQDKTEVIVLTNNYRITGKISLVPGARLTDYIVSANSFIAMIEAEVRDRTGKLLLNTPFLDVSRSHIEIILPAEFAEVSNK